VSTLAGVQGDFQEYLLRGDSAIEAHVAGTERVPVATRLAIYGGGYGSRLAEALASNFPALAHLLGETDFQTLANAYVRSHESPFFSIRHYGDRLEQFLATDAQYSGAPVLTELARWEWTLGNVFDAADATPVTHEALARVQPQQWAQLRFGWHPSVQRLELHWNAPQIWQAATEKSEPPGVSFTHEPQPWLVWRQELTTYFRSLPKAEVVVLDAARKGWPFGELCALLCDEVGDAEAPMQAATLLRGWVAAGLIIRAQ
jgi:hypothetical protein